MIQDLFKELNWAPVQAFAHAPLRNNWKTNDIVVVDTLSNNDKYWRAKIVKTYGYYVEIAWLNSSNGMEDFTSIVNFYHQNLLPIVDGKKNENVINTREFEPPVGLSKANIVDIFNLPPKYTTYQQDLYGRFLLELKPNFPVDQDVLFECLDFDNPSRLVPCHILHQFGGWLLIEYLTDDRNVHQVKKLGTWVHPKSGFIRVCGWSQMVNYPILATESYVKMSYFLLTQEDDFSDRYLTDPDLFPFEPDMPNHFEIGSYMEFLDPLSNRMRIVKVCRKIRFGFMVLEYEDYNTDAAWGSKKKQIFQHVTSRLIFPCGFCRVNKIPLYLSDAHLYESKLFPELEQMMFKNSPPLQHFPKIERNNFDFRIGNILEVFLVNGYGYINYAIIKRIVGRLISLQLLTKKARPEVWVECESYMIKPFGFTHLLHWDEISKSNIFMFNPGSDLQKRIKELEGVLCPENMVNPFSEEEDIYLRKNRKPQSLHPISQKSKINGIKVRNPITKLIEEVPFTSGAVTNFGPTMTTMTFPAKASKSVAIKSMINQSIMSFTPLITTDKPANSKIAAAAATTAPSSTSFHLPSQTPQQSISQPIVTASANRQPIKAAALIIPLISYPPNTNPVIGESLVNAGESCPSSIKPSSVTSIIVPPKTQEAIGQSVLKASANCPPSIKAPSTISLIVPPQTKKVIGQSLVKASANSPPSPSTKAPSTISLIVPPNTNQVVCQSLVKASANCPPSTKAPSTISIIVPPKTNQAITGSPVKAVVNCQPIRLQQNSPMPVVLKHSDGTVLILRPEGSNLGLGAKRGDQSGPIEK